MDPTPSLHQENARAVPFRFESVVAAFLSNVGSQATTIEYARTTREFLSFIAAHIDTLSDLKRDHIIFYRKSLAERGLAHNTILKKLAGVSSLCKFLAQEGMIERDLTYGVKRPKTYNKKETAALTEEEVRRMFASLSSKAFSFSSHRALLAIGFYTGLRSGEIRNLKVKDFTEVEGHRIIRTKIKGDKPHEVPLNPFVIYCLDEHLARLHELGFEVKPEHYLFPRLRPRRNEPMSGKTLRQILQSALKRAGVHLSPARRYSPHSMRATLATHLLNKVEAPLEDVQRLLGHSSPSTTQHYNKRKKSHDKSPVYKIDY